MFNWLRRLFGNESSFPVHFKYESSIPEYSKYDLQILKEIQEALDNNKDPSELMKMLSKDFLDRSRKKPEGGSSSSPISSS